MCSSLRPYQVLLISSLCNSLPTPHTPWVTPDGELTSCHTEYQLIWEDKEVEELVEICNDEKVEKCVIKSRRECRPKCVKVRRKVCRTVNTKQCRRRHLQGRGKRKCVTNRVCDYQWEVEGDVEIMAEVPGSCREIRTEDCGQDLSSREVCEDTPVNICEQVEEEECEEFEEEDCSESPVLICKQETENRCQDVIKRVKKKVSKRAERKVCRKGKENFSSQSTI